MLTRFVSIRDRAVSGLGKASAVPPLVVRLTLAGVFVQSGWGKLHDIPRVVGFFTSLHLPWPEFQAYLVAVTEFVGGLLVLLGLGTRLASIPLAITMVVAIATAKWSDVHEMTDVFALSEYLYILLFLWLIQAGAGAVSLDHWILNRFKRGR